MISIWFFIGVLLLVYGILIMGAGIYGLSHPPNVKLADLNVGVWWGGLLTVLGLFYTLKFKPRRGN
jgi:hypothetical protein